MKKIDWLEILLFVLGGLLALLIFVAVIIIAYPKTGDRAVRNVGESFERAFGYDPQEKVTEIFTAVGNRARGGWEQRIVKLPDKLKVFRKPVVAKKERSQVDEEKLAVEFNECKKCHSNFMEREVFNKIYLNHRQHLTNGVKCYECHKGNVHPKPNKVDEKDCLNCHKKLEDSARLVENCETCHTPGSIINNVKGDSPSTLQFLASRKMSSLMPQGFQHGKSEACNSCHNTLEFCNRCHLVFHHKLPNWIEEHGENILRKRYHVKGCAQCHKNSWCSMKCHPNPNRQRREGDRELPVVPIDEYLP